MSHKRFEDFEYITVELNPTCMDRLLRNGLSSQYGQLSVRLAVTKV